MTRTRRAALLLATIIATSACSGASTPAPTRSSTSPSSVPATSAGVSASAWPSEPQNAGFGPPAPGSLAADTELTRTLRRQVQKHVAKNNRNRKPPAAEDITVVSAGDVGEVRYAEVVYPLYRHNGRTEWARMWWLRPADSEGGGRWVSFGSVQFTRLSADPEAVFLKYSGDSTGGLVLVSAPGAKRVTLPAGSPKLKPDGGAGWSAEVADAVLSEQTYLVDGTKGTDKVSFRWPSR